MIEIWGRTGCAYCDAAKALCEQRGLVYQYYQLGEQFTREQLIEQFPTAKTYPQIKAAGTYVGGYDELTTYLEETGYTGTGDTL